MTDIPDDLSRLHTHARLPMTTPSSEIHVIIRATLALTPGAAEVELDELYEPLQQAAAAGLANHHDVAAVRTCAALELLAAGTPGQGHLGCGRLPDPSGDEPTPLPGPRGR